MSRTGTLNQARRPRIVHISSLFAASSHQRCASVTAAVSATAAFGCRSTHSPRIAKDFSGWSRHSSPVTSAV